MLGILLCAAGLAGLAAGATRPLEPGWMVVAVAGAGLGLGLGWRVAPVRVLALLVVVGAGGAARGATAAPPEADGLTPLAGWPVVALGRIDSPLEPRGRVVTFRLAVVEVNRRDQLALAPARTLAEAAVVEVVSWPDEVDGLGLGDWVEAEGRLARPTSTAGYPRAELLRRRGVLTTLAFPRLQTVATARDDPQAGVARLRAGIRAGFERYLPQPHAGLAYGMLLGGSVGLEAEFRQQIQATGLGHLIAVSGYNVVVVGAALLAVARRAIGGRGSLLPVLFGVAGYTALTGAPASAVRAALMFGLAMLATAVGRVADPLTSVLVAAAAMAAVDPAVLFDLGFQLSVAATLGLILLYPRLRPGLAWLPRWAAEPVGLSLAAQLATLPIILLVFRQISLVAPLANLLAVPLVPAVMVGGGVLALALAAPGLATILAWLPWLPTTLLVEIIRRLGSVDGAAVFTGQLPGAMAWLLAWALLAWGLAGLPELAWLGTEARRAASAFPRSTWAAVGLGLGLALALALVHLGRPDGRLHVVVLGTGGGEAVLLRGPDGTTVLVPASGVDGRGLASLVGDHLPLWERSLGAVVLLEAVDEPLAAETVRRYPPRRWLGGEDARLDLGGGAVLDVYGEGPGVAVTHGGVWLQVAGSPPPPVSTAGGGPLVAVVGGDRWPSTAAAPHLVVGPRAALGPTTWLIPTPRERALGLASDGVSIWRDGGSDQPGEQAESSLAAPARSGPG